MSAAVFNCGEKRKSAFLMGDTCAESNNINTAAAVLGKPFTCMSSPQKKKGVLKQKGERRNSLGEKRPKQTAATMRNFQHHQCWQLNTKPNKIRICYY